MEFIFYLLVFQLIVEQQRGGATLGSFLVINYEVEETAMTDLEAFYVEEDRVVHVLSLGVDC